MNSLSLDVSSVVYKALNTAEKLYGGLVSTIEVMAEKRRINQSIKNTIKELQGLTDRDLRDMGINLSDIETAIREQHEKFK